MNNATATPHRVDRTLAIRLFGAFRQFGDESAVTVTVPDNARVADVRDVIRIHYAGNDNALALLKASAFATDRAVLDEDDRLPAGEPLSLLPPVCGG